MGSANLRKMALWAYFIRLRPPNAPTASRFAQKFAKHSPMNAPREPTLAAQTELARAFDATLLARRLRAACRGDVLFDVASRGRYATDASIYQIFPIGVVVPADAADLRTALDVARDDGIPLLPRGAGSSQCGQTVGEALVIDHSKALNAVGPLDRSVARHEDSGEKGEGRSLV